MSGVLDRLEAQAARYTAARNVTMQVGPALEIGAIAVSLVPLLREWEAAWETPGQRLRSADIALLAALRAEVAK